MTAIYKPRGAAREYCDLAINLYRGCAHWCSYCYAPAVLRMTKTEFGAVSARRNIIESIAREAPQHKGGTVLMCFTCDPYQQADVKEGLTREAIRILHRNEIKAKILTKGGTRSERDFDILSARPDLSAYGATLTFVGASDSKAHEPGAALPDERFSALEKAHRLGIPTWVSLEPVIDPEQTLEIIRMTRKYVDEYKVGKLNHAKTETDWEKFGMAAVSLLKSLGKKFYVKDDLRRCLRTSENILNSS